MKNDIDDCTSISGAVVKVYIHLCTVQIGERLGTWYLPVQQSDEEKDRLVHMDLVKEDNVYFSRLHTEARNN